MKRLLLIILTVIVIVVVVVLSKYNEYKTQKDEITSFNVEYEQYLDKQIYGDDIATIINKAVDDNEKNLVEKDENNVYIQNDINSVNIEVKIHDLEEDTIYTMETLYNGGMSQFVQYYNTILFECTNIEYNSAGKVCYMLFEQMTT